MADRERRKAHLRRAVEEKHWAGAAAGGRLQTMRLFVFATLLLFAAPGCGTSIIVDQAHAAAVINPLIDGTGDAIHAARASELDACARFEDLDERRTCLDEGEASWAPAMVAYNLTATAQEAWVRGLALAALSQMDDMAATNYLAPFVAALLRAYEGVRTALEPFDALHVPDWPDLSVWAGMAGSL